MFRYVLCRVLASPAFVARPISAHRRLVLGTRASLAYQGKAETAENTPYGRFRLACRANNFEEAYKVLPEIENSGQANPPEYGTLLAVLAKRRDVQHHLGLADSIVTRMQERGIEPEGHVLSMLITAHTRGQNVDRAVKIFEQGCERGIPILLPHFITAGITALCRARRFDDAARFLVKLKGLKVYVPSSAFGALVSSLLRIGDGKSAAAVMQHMRDADVKPDVVVLNSWVQYLVSREQFAEAFSVRLFELVF
jgi:pentatricopeptide repeat protein